MSEANDLTIEGRIAALEGRVTQLEMLIEGNGIAINKLFTRMITAEGLIAALREALE